MFYDDDINITKRKTITNGKPYDFFIYDLMPIEKEFDETKKFGKGDTVISKCKEFTLLDYETGKKLEVKIRCSKKIDDAMEGLEPKYSKKVFRKCLKELENRGLTRIKKK
ncbi:MAG: hypothetical protein VX896_02630 [Candidatus Neomarinimicrobiota bacterium]|nr:hypothetical protein [Candidatus Neomarinimicrobiota bacterium]